LVSKSVRCHYLVEIQGALARHNSPRWSACVRSTETIQRRLTHKADRAQAPASEQFRNANDSLASPSVEQQNWSEYSEGHVISAPAGQ
jgi:hypothetical protein